MSQPSLFLTEPSASAPVAGFSYWPEAFTAAEERDWLHAIESLPFKPFEFHGYLGKRRIVSFGWHYDYSGRALRPSTPMPDIATSRCSKMWWRCRSSRRAACGYGASAT